MTNDIYVVSYLAGLRPVLATVCAASPMQALRTVQSAEHAQGREPLQLLVESLCPSVLLAPN